MVASRLTVTLSCPNWHIVGTNVSDHVLDCINFGKFLQSINFTHITLIPKKKNPELMSHFRPINLCNVIFKLVSKVMANRLKRILGKIIFDYQSAFVAKRVITDNIFISFEILHYMKSKCQGNTAHMALKLDMSKAYDRVEWDYLKGIMLKMGFHHRLVDLIMAGISFASYSVLVNGVPLGFIKPFRRIRQGDPLSPHLFLLCSEGFSALLRNALQQRLLHGVSISRNGPQITHVLFADDSSLFCKACSSECHIIKEILQIYEAASGQKISCEMSSIFSSPTLFCQPEMRSECYSILHPQNPLKNILVCPQSLVEVRNKLLLKSNFVSNPNSVGGKLNYYLRPGEKS